MTQQSRKRSLISDSPTPVTRIIILLVYSLTVLNITGWVFAILLLNSDNHDWTPGKLITTGILIVTSCIFCVFVGITTRSLKKVDRIRKEKESELLKSNKRLEILSSTARHLLEADKPQKIVDDLCKDVMDFLDCHVFFNFLMVQEPYPHLELNACGGISESNTLSLKWLEIGVAVCGCVARDGYPIMITDIQNNMDARANLVRKFGVQAYACHPLLDHGNVIGTLSFGSKSRIVFSADDLSLMKAVTDSVAIAMARKKSEEEILRLNQNLEKRVIKRTLKLEESFKEMEAFTYSVSHDLRAPLRHISGYVGLLEKKSFETLDATSKNHLKIIAESAEKMGILIDDILDFARLSRAQMSTQEVDIGQLVDDVLEMTKQDCNGRDIKFDIGPLPSIRGDQAMLRIVMMNLITNAIKFTAKKEDSRIAIGQMEEMENYFTIFVKDNGSGFDMQFSDKLFVLFQRLHDEKDFPGTGLGLAITKKIIERHGGTIRAEGYPDRGATFYFSIPRYQDQMTERVEPEKEKSPQILLA